MKTNANLEQWLMEEQVAHIHGWDFSHIAGRYEEKQDFPWDYARLVRECLRTDSRLLDIDTGGGEFLRSLMHPNHLTSATEGYPPNVTLCEETLLPKGIDFRPMREGEPIPSMDGTFDVIVNRHGSYQPSELWRALRPGGWFITQQVGEANERELVALLLPGCPRPFPGWNPQNAKQQLQEQGFTITLAEEAFRPIYFYDVGAFVWYAHIIEWEFPGFAVSSCLERLQMAQTILDQDGVIAGNIHRFAIVAQKPLSSK